MSRPKIPRKSTSIDMTAMCDVAFLLLSFFILTTKFKPSEPVPVVTPSSVASKIAPDKDVVLISIERSGKVFLEMDNETKKSVIADMIKSRFNIPVNKSKFISVPFFGSPISKLPSYLEISKDEYKSSIFPGIPSLDSTIEKNELINWITMIKDAYNGEKLNLLVKGDNVSKYPSFQAVLFALKKNDLLKFQMVTNPESVPLGTDLWKSSQSSKTNTNLE